MELKHQSYIDLETVYKRELQELKELTAYFNRIDERNRILSEEHKAIRENREVELREARKYEESKILFTKQLSTN